MVSPFVSRFSSALPGTGSNSRTQKTFSPEKLSTSVTPSTEDAARVTLSSETPETRATDYSERRIGVVTNTVNALKNVTSSVDEVLDRLEAIAKRSEGRQTTQAVEDARAEEAMSLLSEVDRISSEADLFGLSVVSRGALALAVDANGADTSSASEFHIVVPNVSVATTNLGLNGLTGDDFSSSSAASQTLTTLADAKRTLSDISGAVVSAESREDIFTQSYAHTIVENEGAGSDSPEKTAENFAERALAATEQGVVNNSELLLSAIKNGDRHDDPPRTEERTKRESLSKVSSSAGEDESDGSRSGSFSAIA